MSAGSQARRLERRREDRALTQAIIKNTNELKAVWAAMAQYVENGHTNEMAEDPHEADPLLASAEEVLERLDAAVAALAEES